MSQLFAAFTILFVVAFNATAKDIQPMFEKLKDSAENYEIVGTVCEQVARLEMYETYPESKYYITTGIEYGDNSRTIGELDVVVIDKATEKVEVSAEVKCWKNLNGARKKAMDQRNRFIRTLQSSKPIFMHNDKDGEFEKAQFSNVKRFISIAQNGSVKAGFEVELSYTLDELMNLRRQLMDCQHRGQCPSHRE